MEKGKTIKQLADEIGVSKQAVHQKRKNKELAISLQPFTTIVDGVVYISTDGQKLIKQAFLKNECKQIDVNETSLVDTLVYTLQEQLKQKDKQIENLQEENKRLVSALENTTLSLQASQTLHAKDIQLLSSGEASSEQTKKRKNIFDIFKK
jgi:transcriptional regulator with XRE-family HTH domain